MISYEKYAKIRDRKELKDVDVAKRADISPSTLTAWKQGKYEPKTEKLVKIAEVLDMNYSELVGLYDKFSEVDSIPSTQESFDTELLHLYHNATPDAQKSVMTLLKNSQKEPSKLSKEA